MLHRRTFLGAVGSGLLAAVQASPSASQSEADYWTVVALPDTQFYAASEDLLPYATDQTDWIVDSLDSESIEFVTHEGDMVNNGWSDEQWRRIDGVMSTLDGAVPYSTLPGNHDWASTNDKSSSVRKYTAHFGPTRFEDRSWYGGATPGGRSSYQLFSGGGYEFLHLALEWEPPGTVSDTWTPLGWAQAVLDDYPDLPTIVTTHSYLRDDGGRATQVQDYSKTGHPGETVWERLIEPNEQIFMVLNGHWFRATGENYQVSTNGAGLPVYEIASNYQHRPNGGSGLLRLLQFVPGGGADAPDRIRVRTYSPSLDSYQQQGAFAVDLDFEQRFGERSAEPIRTTIQQRADGYAETVDTNLREDDPEDSFETAEAMTVDTQDPHYYPNPTQVLLRFGSLVGEESGQIPPGATIQQATLALETVDEGSGGAVHQLRTDWRSDATWNSVGGGIQPDGEQATETPVAETGWESVGTTTIDVTQSVQRWSDGAENYGWAILPLGSNGWDFQSSNGEIPPKLTVDYHPPETDDSDDDSDSDDGDTNGGDDDGSDSGECEAVAVEEDSKEE